MLFCRKNFKNMLFVLLSCLLAGIASDAVAAAKYDLRAKKDPTTVTRVKVMMEVKGQLKFMVNKKKEEVTMLIKGNLTYDDKSLRAPAKEKKSIRYYHEAKADMLIGKSKIQKKLSKDLRYVAINSSTGKVVQHGHQGLLSRDELDLISLPADSTIIDRLLPNQPVSVHDEWEHSEKLLAGLLSLDAASSAKVKSKLISVTGNIAKISLNGKLDGAIDGIASEIELLANYHYDLKQRRITSIALEIIEDRGIGHVGPGVTATTRLKMLIGPALSHTQLLPTTLAKLNSAPKASRLLLADAAMGGKVLLNYDRRWHMIDNDSKRLLLRYVDQGDLVSQCHLSMLPVSKKPGVTQTLEQFRDEIKKSLGKRLSQFVKVAQSSNANDYRVYRIEALGKVDALDIRWCYYFIADKHGNQAVMAFTTENELVTKLANADQKLVDHFHFTHQATKQETASYEKIDSTKK